MSSEAVSEELAPAQDHSGGKELRRSSIRRIIASLQPRTPESTQPAPPAMFTLANLKSVGQRARIVDIHGDDGIAARLLEMGLTPGEEISVIGFAPLRDPVEYAVRGYRLSLRMTEASRVEVEGVES